MRYGRYGLPYTLLRIGLGITFVWIGVDILRNPSAWIGYMPEESVLDFSREAFLRFAGLYDIVLGLLFIVCVLPKAAGWLAVLHFMGIFAVNGIDAVLVRNIGLLGAALAIALWPSHYHRKRHWWDGRLIPSREKKKKEAVEE